MGAAGVINKLLDLSTRVPSFPGVRGAIVIDAKKGPVNDPLFMTNETQFLDYFTPNGKVEVGYSLGYYSVLAFMQKSSGCWIVRAANNPLYAGCTVRQYGATGSNASLTAGLVDPSSYDLETNNGRPLVTPSNVKVNVVENPFFGVVDAGFYQLSATGDKVKFVGDAAPEPLEVDVEYFLIKGPVFGRVAFAETKQEAIDGISIEMDANFEDPETFLENHEVIAVPAAQMNSLLIYSANEGAWGNDVYIEIHPYRASETTSFSNGGITVSQDWEVGEAVRFSTTGKLPDGLSANATYYIAKHATTGVRSLADSYQHALADQTLTYTEDTDYGTHTLLPAVEYTKEPDSFTILVFHVSNLTNPIETHICSRNPDKMDGFNQNIYVENVLEGSMYIRAIDNTTVSSAVMPKAQLTLLPLGGGTDGSPVTDGAMLRAADTLRNPDSIPMTVFMDGGWATAAYQKQGVISVCEERQDCEGVLSTPYAAEASANYLNEIIDYRKLVLNANTWNAALYTPHVKIYDKFNDRSIYVAPDGYAAAQISETAANYEMWYPVAGFRRGMLNVLDVRRRFTATRAGGGEIGLLYDAGINPIRFYPGKGILIWGQKTLSARPSALDRLNVALLLIVIRPAIAEALEDYLFQLNDPGERRLIRSMIESYMDGIKARRGVYEYLVVCDETNNSPEDIDNYRLNVDLYIKPTKAIEYIHFTTVIARTGDSLEALTNLAAG